MGYLSSIFNTNNRIVETAKQQKPQIDFGSAAELRGINIFSDTISTSNDNCLFTENEESLSDKQKTQDKNNSVWHEGTDRQISKIVISEEVNADIFEQLKAIGEKEGFNLEQVESQGSMWIEDNSIRRHDGKNLVPSAETIENLKDFYYISDERTFFKNAQGSVAANYEEQTYSDTLDNIVEAKSYLEGGNVLNTKLKDESPAAIIGNESINYSLKGMNLEDTPENRELVIEQIAKDLGIKKENVTIIPQYGFHIDMDYRPLGNETIAVPDYESALKIEEEVFGSNSTQYQLLKTAADKTLKIRQDAEEELIKKGYKIIKVPNFHSGSIPQGGLMNFMNAVTGTNKDGKTYYITASSDVKEIDEQVEKHLKKAGIDNVYFIKGLKEYIENDGSLDCLTQES